MTDRIHNIDCLEGLKQLPDNSIDLTVTSPPYDNLRTYNGYSFGFEGIAQELFRVTKDGGVVVWIVGDATVKGSETGTSFKQALYFKEIGFNLHDTMIFRKENPIPLTHNRCEQEFEYMFVFTNGRPKTFHPLTIPCKRVGHKNRRDVGIVQGASTRNRDEITVTKHQKQIGNIWSFAIGKGGTTNDLTKHPAMFPEKLANDHIITWSNPGDIILDPFMGSGTTAKMALLNDRHFIGFEISAEYCEIAEKRIAEARGI